MFQMIVAVISIALVAALAIASIYYGGEAFTKSSLRAQVTTLVNGGQQISGAVALYNTDYPGSLVTGDATAAFPKAAPGAYLSAEPGHTLFTSGNWKLDSSAKTIEIVIASTASNLGEICEEVARQATSDTAGTGGQFSCVTYADPGETRFVFKF